MRMLLKVTIPVEAGNAAIKNGTLGPTIQKILGQLKPEAAYFMESEGQRTGIIVVDIKNASDIPGIAEPFFLSFGGRIELHPCMTPADLAAAGPDLERSAKEYGG